MSGFMQQPPIVPPPADDPHVDDPRIEESVAIDPDIDPDLIDSAEVDRIAAGAKPSKK